MKTHVSIGDSIGEILNIPLKKKFVLFESKVKCIKVTKKKTKLHCEKFFRGLDENEVKENTEWLKENKNIVLLYSPFLIDDEIRERVTKWCETATNNYDEFNSIEMNF